MWRPVLCSEFCTRLCCTFSFCRSILSNCSSTVSLHGPTWFQHGANMTPTMAPTVHNITIWFEHILACRFPHSHLGQVSDVSLEIRVLRSCLVRKLGLRDIFLLIEFVAFYSNFVSARSALSRAG